MNIFSFIYRVGKRIIPFFYKSLWIIAFLKLKLSGVSFYSDFKSGGVPLVRIRRTAKVSIGHSFVMNNGEFYNMIGRQQTCIFSVESDAVLSIGDNVGISSTTFVCQNRIKVEDNVCIGGGTVIYDTNFHSLDFQERMKSHEDRKYIKTAPVLIKKNAFIGAHCIILKGVVIGENSIIGAGSVVRVSVPDNEIWAGNPAVFIKKNM